MKLYLNEDSYEAILTRIFARAFEDYVFAIMNNKVALQKDCERFFKSEYATDLVSGNWKKHCERIKENALKFKKLTDGFPSELYCPQCGAKIRIYRYKRKNSYIRYSCPTCYLRRTMRVNKEVVNAKRSK